MTFADPQAFGFSPHFGTSEWPLPTEQQEISIGRRTVSFNPSKPVHVTRGLIGRCTTIFAAMTQDSDTGRERQCILKLSYQPCDRNPSEVDHYTILSEKGIKGVPEILCSQKLAGLQDGPRGRLMESLPQYKFGPMRYLEAIVMANMYEPIKSIDINRDTKLFFEVFLSLIEGKFGILNSICS